MMQRLTRTAPVEAKRDASELFVAGDGHGTLSAGSRPDLSKKKRRTLLIGIWLVLTAFFIVRQAERETLTLLPDELYFAKLAQNLASGQGFTYRGASSPYNTLYPFLLAPFWAVLSTAAAYHVVLGINAAVMTATFFPAYVIAARITTFWWAVAAACGTVLVPAMVLASTVLTEPFAYPLAALALLAMIEALRKPGWRSTALVAGAVAAAVAVRAQMWVLVPTFALALVIDALRFAGSDLGTRLRAHKWALGGLGIMVAAGLLALGTESLRGILGSYADTAEDLPNLGRLASLSVDYIGVLVVASLGLPVIAAVTLALHRSSWRDHELAAVLAVAVSALLMMIVQAAWFSATISPELRERYVFYATPALAACWVALWKRQHWKTLIAVTAAISVYTVLVFPGFSPITEGWVENNLAQVVDRLLGVSLPWLKPFGLNEQLAAAVGLMGLLAAVSTRLRGRAGAVALLVPTMAFGFLVLNLRQTEANRQSNLERAHLPRQADWIDRLSAGPAALLVTRGTEPFRVWDLEFWNRDLDRVFLLDTRRYPGTAACPLVVAEDGSLSPRKECQQRGLPRYLAFVNSHVQGSMQNARLRYRDRMGWRLFELPASGKARVRSLLYGCQTVGVPRCTNAARLEIWTPARGELAISIKSREPDAKYRISGEGLGSAGKVVAAGSTRLRIPRGHSQVRIEPSGKPPSRAPMDWRFELTRAKFRTKP